MIWHFVEVWVLMLIAFFVGSAIGAVSYDVLARSRFATAQGIVADAVGDMVDGIKARMGVGPVWRPEYRRVAGRAMLAEDGELDLVAFQEPPAVPFREPAALPPPTQVAAVGDPVSRGHENPVRDEFDATEPQAYDDDLDDAVAEESDPAIAAGEIVAMRPAGLASPRNGVPDNLQRIRGIGERNEGLLNSLGIYHFGQIAAWTPGEVGWVGAYLAFPERIERDDWVGQATILASGGDTGFVKAADRRRARRQRDQFDDDPIDDGAPEEAVPDDV